MVVAWWDYGDWLSDIGNVTTLCDNTTYNTTQIENVGFIMMGNENQSMQMLSNYENYNNPGRVNYILVFTVLAISQSSSGTGYTASPEGYGDEGKWVWMARHFRNSRAMVYKTWLHECNNIDSVEGSNSIWQR